MADYLADAAPNDGSGGAVRDVVGIRCGALSGNMKISFQAGLA